MSREKEYEVEIEASHTVKLVMEDGYYLTINPFAIIEEMIYDAAVSYYPIQILKDLGEVQKYLAYEMKED